MARIRSIKPEFWSSEQVMECSVTARLMFIGMWNFADDLGRIPLLVKSIKAKVFPSDEMASEIILGMIAELSRNGLLQPYTVDGVEFLQIKSAIMDIIATMIGVAPATLTVEAGRAS